MSQMASQQHSHLLVLAADNPTQVLAALREDPALAPMQDENGYSLLHAAASYGHADLLRALVNEFNVKVDLKDCDGETALFVVEKLEIAKMLVEELHANILIRSAEDGKTARERIAEDDDYPHVAVYLRMKELEVQVNGVPASTSVDGTNEETRAAPPIPEGLRVDIGQMTPEEAGEVVNPEFRRQIEELAAREDFHEAGGQEQLRALITSALADGGIDIYAADRDVRQRTH